MSLKDIKNRLKKVASTREARAFSIADMEPGLPGISVPLIGIYDKDPQRASGIAGGLARLFKGDGYYAVTAETGKQSGPPHISLADCCRPGNFDLVSGLKTLNSVYDADLILLMENIDSSGQKIKKNVNHAGHD